MTEQQNKKELQKKKLKKYLVFAVLALLFAASIYWIFAPSGSSKAPQDQMEGFNSELPDPKVAGIVEDKKTAYEQEQALLKQESRMQSLQDFSFMLHSENGNNEEYDEPEDVPVIGSPGSSRANSHYREYGNTPSGYSSYQDRRSNSFESSNSAYRDINRTLGNFYVEPEDDPEKDELREEIAKLKAMMAEQQQVSTSYDEQVALLEKSYEMAAKYMTGADANSGTVENNNIGNTQSGKKLPVAAVSHVNHAIVSTLRAPISDLEFIQEYSRERNSAFQTLSTENNIGLKNTVDAVIHGDQTLVNGQKVKVRVTEGVRVGQYVIPANTVLTGIGKFSGERMDVSISSVEYAGNIMQVNIEVYDTDGLKGINIPGSMELAAMKEITGNMGQNLGSTINITQQGAGEQLLADLGRGAIQGTSQYISKKAREIKVTLKSGYRILLLPNNDN